MNNGYSITIMETQLQLRISTLLNWLNLSSDFQSKLNAALFWQLMNWPLIRGIKVKGANTNV